MKTSHHLIYTCFFILSAVSLQAQNAYITTWQVGSSDMSILIPVNPAVTGYNYTVNWGDGNTSTGNTGDATHTYANAGTYTVSISGDFPAIQFGSATSGTVNDQKIREIVQWGTQVWQSMHSAFKECTNLTTESSGDAPVLAPEASLYQMFYKCDNFNSNLNDWDVSQVTTMRWMFYHAEKFNQPIGSWDVSNVTNMGHMFERAMAFNQDIGSWKVSNVTNMDYMFTYASVFYQDIRGWDVSSVTTMDHLFDHASAFNYDLGDWDISNVTSMVHMLSGSGLFPHNYDNTLIDWAVQNVQMNVNLGANGLKYCSSLASRQTLIDDRGWSFNGDAIREAACDPYNPDAFTTTWRVPSGSRTITIPVNSNISGYNFTVNWGDGNITSGYTGDASHNYSKAGTYTVSITGNFPAIRFESSVSPSINDGKLLTIEQWGTQVWQGMGFAFMECSNLTSESATDAPIFAPNSDLSLMFYACSKFNSDLSDWDVSNVVDMSDMFTNASKFNQDISSWDVSNVRDMWAMFAGASEFNQDLSSWDVSNVERMGIMFDGASVFNQDISSWDVSRVTTMRSMFYASRAFNQNLGNWDVSKVEDMEGMLSISALSTENYDKTLIGWTSQNVKSNIKLGADVLKYCLSTDARQSLIDDHNWTITGDAIENQGCIDAGSNAFITTWRVNSNNENIVIPVNPTLSGYNYTVNWGDGNLTSGHTGDASHTYAVAGSYTVMIIGNFPAIQFGSSTSSSSNDDKLRTIEQWGSQVWQGMEQAFASCSNLTTESNTDAPVFAPGSSLDGMFKGCTNFNSDLSDWDVSNVNSTEGMFDIAQEFNQDIGNWDVSNVTSMYRMFANASKFNKDIGDWDVSKVTDMESMFINADAFNQDIRNWDVSKVTNIESMFSNTASFNQNLSSWDVSNVSNMSHMFFAADAFNQDIGGWDISKVTSMVNILSKSGLSTFNYDKTLLGWAAQNIQSNVNVGAAELTYCAAIDARQSLIDDYGWTFFGDAVESSVCTPTGPEAFIMTWQVSSNGESITIPVNPDIIGYNYTVNWGDAYLTSGHTGNANHTYGTSGTYTVSITGDFPAIQFGSSISNNANDQKLRTIEQWGSQVWEGMEEAFNGCSNLTTESDSDTPIFAPQSSLKNMFYACPNYNSDLSDWDVSKVTNMDGMFSFAYNFNQEIGSWDVSNVTNMDYMFSRASKFNQNIGNWDVSNVTTMNNMFLDAYNFNQNIGNWDVSKVTFMVSTFRRASEFSQDIGNWDISKVTNMDFMLTSSGLSTENYDKTLIGWASQNVLPNVTLGAQSMTYCTAADARTRLIDSLGWSINGDTYDSECKLLPITILAFEAHNFDEEVQLSWTLNADEPMHELVLQKSYDGVKWADIYQENLLNYVTGQNIEGSYTDHEMMQSRMHYRLNITEVSGASTYSQLLQVNMPGQESSIVYYNNSNQRIVIKARQNYAGRMQLINVRGQNVMTKKIKILKNTIQEIDIQKYFTAGIYFVRFEDRTIPPVRIFVY